MAENTHYEVGIVISEEEGTTTVFKTQDLNEAISESVAHKALSPDSVVFIDKWKGTEIDEGFKELHIPEDIFTFGADDCVTCPHCGSRTNDRVLTTNVLLSDCLGCGEIFLVEIEDE